MTQEILTHAEGGVTTVTLNRLERKNSITSAMYGAMADALEAAAKDAATRVVVFQGHETVFSAGNDIGDFLHQPPAGQDAPVFRFLRGIATHWADPVRGSIESVRTAQTKAIWAAGRPSTLERLPVACYRAVVVGRGHRE